MTVLQGSRAAGLLLRLCGGFARSYDGSATARLTRRLGACLRRFAGGSRILSLLARDGPLTRLWADSLFSRALTGLLNLPVLVLRVVCRPLRGAAKGSVFCRLLFGDDALPVVLLSWLTLALLAVPHEMWNNLYSLAAVAAIFAAACACAVRRRGALFQPALLGPGLFFFALFVCLAYVFSVQPPVSLRYLLFHLTGLGLALLCHAVIRRVSQLERLAAFAAAGLFAASLYACYQRAMGIEVDAMMVDLTANQDTPGRVYSVFENPNAFAVVIVLLLPVALALLFYARALWLRLFMLPVAAIAAAALIMTYSRGAWAGFAVTVVVFVLLLRPGLTPLLFALGLLALPLLPPSVLNRIQSMANSLDTSMSSRVPVYRAMLSLAGDYPVSGVGLGSDAVRLMIDKSGHYHSETLFIHGHNIYLQLWVETGLFGLLSFLGMMFAALRGGARAALCRTAQPLLRGLSAAGVSGLAGTLVYSLADYPWSYPRVMTIFWLAFALPLCAAKLARIHPGAARHPSPEGNFARRVL